MTIGGSARERAEELRAQAAAARARAAELEREAGAWQAGAEGEDRVAAALDRLPKGCRALHDRLLHPATSRVNLDHLAVTPGGVFLIDAKNWAGDVTVYQDNLWRHSGALGEGRSSVSKHRELLKVAWAAGEVEKALGHPVTPVLALAGAKAARFEPVRVRGVEVVPLRALVPWLTSRGGRLTSWDVDRLVLTAGLAFPEATERADCAGALKLVTDHGEPRIRPRRVPKAPRVRRITRAGRLTRRVALGVGGLLLLVWGTGMILGAVQLLTSTKPGQAVANGVGKGLSDGGALPGSARRLVAEEKPCEALTPAAMKKVLGKQPLPKATPNDEMCGWYLSRPASPYSTPEVWVTMGTSARLQSINLTKTAVTAGAGTVTITVPQSARVRESAGLPAASVPFKISLRYSYPKALNAARIKATDAANARKVTALAAALAEALEHKHPAADVAAGTR